MWRRLDGNGAGGMTLRGWATADGMGNNAGQAYYGISKFCQMLTDDCDNMIVRLRLTVANYADAETAMKTAANNVSTGTGSSVWATRRGMVGIGVGWAAISGRAYPVKTMAVTPASPSGMKASEIEALFSYLDPSAVAEAGRAHTAMSRALQSFSESLITHAQALANGWGGKAAQASIARFRQLHEATVQLAQQSAQTGQALTWLGEIILPYYKNWKAHGDEIVGRVENLFGHNPQDHAAQQVMERLNDRLSQANAALPANITFDAPKMGRAERAPLLPPTIGSIPGSGIGAAVTSARLTGNTSATVSPAGSGSGDVTGVTGSGPGPGGSLGSVPTAPTAPSGGHVLPPTQLAGGVGNVPGGQGGVPGGGSLPGGGAQRGGIPSAPAPIGPMPPPGQGTGPRAGGSPGEGASTGGSATPGEIGVLHGGSGPRASGTFGEPVVGPDGMIGTGHGMVEGQCRAGTTGFIGAEDGATQPGGGFPMTGGSAGGGRENDRYRQSWMPEDVDTWEGDTA